MAAGASPLPQPVLPTTLTPISPAVVRTLREPTIRILRLHLKIKTQYMYFDTNYHLAESKHFQVKLFPRFYLWTNTHLHNNNEVLDRWIDRLGQRPVGE